jgi:chorismate synthase
VAAGAIAEKWLRERFGVEIIAWVSSVGSECDTIDEHAMCIINREQVRMLPFYV